MAGERGVSAADELQRPLGFSGRTRCTGGVGPAAVGKVGPAGAADRLPGRGRRAVGLGEAAAAHERERPRVPGVVGAQLASAGAHRVQRLEQPLRLATSPATASAHAHAASASPRSAGAACADRVEQLDRAAGRSPAPRAERRSGRGRRAPGAATPAPAPAARRRASSSTARSNATSAASRRTRHASSSPSSSQASGTSGVEREGLGEKADRLIDPRDAARVTRGPDELRRGGTIIAGEAEMTRDLRRTGDRAGRLAREQRAGPCAGAASADVARRPPRRRHRAGAHAENRSCRRRRAAVRSASAAVATRPHRANPSCPISSERIGRVATAARSTSRRASGGSGPRAARAAPRRLGATSSCPRSSALAVSTRNNGLPSARSTTRRTPRSLSGAAARASAAAGSAASGPSSSSHPRTPRARSTYSSWSAAGLCGSSRRVITIRTRRPASRRAA